MAVAEAALVGRSVAGATRLDEIAWDLARGNGVALVGWYTEDPAPRRARQHEVRLRARVSPT